MITKKAGCVTLLALLLLSLCGQSAFAQQSEVNFSVRAIIPENQIDKRQTYFNLRMTPGAAQDIEVEIFNNGAQDLPVRVDITAAGTNANGLIDYRNLHTQDETLRHPLPGIATVAENLVLVPAAGSKTVKISLQMPEQAFDGIVLGGIVLTKEVKNTAQAPMLQAAANTQVTQINNEYSYIIGLQLQETDAVVKPELRLKDVEPTLINYRTGVVAHLQNVASAIIKGMDIKAQVFQGDGVEPLYQAEKSGVSVAPNSAFGFNVEWGNNPVQPGDYRLHLLAMDADNKWEFNQPFTIGSKDANEVNSNAVELSRGWPVWAYVVVGLVLIAVIAGFVVRRRRTAASQ